MAVAIELSGSELETLVQGATHGISFLAEGEERKQLRALLGRLAGAQEEVRHGCEKDGEGRGNPGSGSDARREEAGAIVLRIVADDGNISAPTAGHVPGERSGCGYPIADGRGDVPHGSQAK
jgi:hypothetical protein